jgi:hypothetical protein
MLALPICERMPSQSKRMSSEVAASRNEHMNVRLAIRSGATNAKRCAITPPSECPTTCTRAIFKASSKPSASCAMCSTLTCACRRGWHPGRDCRS